MVDFGQQLRENAFFQRALNLLLWRDLVESGLVFGIGTFFVFLQIVGGYSVIYLLSYLLLALLLVCLVYVYGTVLKARFISHQHAENPLVERFQDRPLVFTREDFLDFVDFAVLILNRSVDCVRHSLFCTDLGATAKFASILFGTALFGYIFSGVALFYFGFLFAFVWPKLYEVKHKEINHYYAKGEAKAREVANLALDKIPKVGPLANLKKKKNE